MLDRRSLPPPRRRALAGVRVGLAVGLGPLVGVAGGLAAAALTYVVSFSDLQLLPLLAAASVGGLVGALSGCAVSGWRRCASWASLAAVAVAVATVVVPELLFSRPDARVGTVVWAVVLLPVLCTVGVLMRRGAPVAGAATGIVGGLLAVDAGVTSLLAWLLRGPATSQLPVWLWFPYSLDGKRHYFPGTLDISDEVGFLPHGMIAATVFAVCLVLVTRRAAAIDPDADELVLRWLPANVKRASAAASGPLNQQHP